MKMDLIDEAPERAMHAAPSLAAPARLRALLDKFPTASKGLLSLVDQAIVSATSFVTAVIINRTTSLDHVGLYYLTLSIVSIAVGVQEHVIAAPYMIYSKRRHGARLAEYTASTWAHHWLLTVAAVVALLAAIASASLTGSQEILPGLWALLGAGPLILLREWIRRFAFVNLDLLAAIALDAAVAALQLGGLLVLARFGELSIYSIYGVMGAACAAACLGWYWLDPPSVRFERRRFRPDWNLNWSFANWALRSYLLGSTTPFIMPWILNLLVGTASTGLYGACWTLVGVTNMFLGAVGRIINVRGAQVYVTGGATELKRVLLWGAAVLASVLGSFLLLVLATGSRLPVLVYGPQFADAGTILAVLAAASLVTGIGSVAGNGLWSIEQPRSNLMADVAGLAVTLVTAACLVAPWGALGGALATLAGAIMAAVARLWTLKRALAEVAHAAR